MLAVPGHVRDAQGSQVDVGRSEQHQSPSSAVSRHGALISNVRSDVEHWTPRAGFSRAWPLTDILRDGKSWSRVPITAQRIVSVYACAVL